LPARGPIIPREKNSSVIARILQANRGVLEIITGDNRSRANAAPALRVARSRDRPVFRRASMQPRISSMRALHRGKTPNMATQIASRNRTNIRFGKIVGTKLESLTQISGECFCASGGYEEGDFSKIFFDPTSIEFPSRCADQPVRRLLSKRAALM
jgi:hypothetical protein